VVDASSPLWLEQCAEVERVLDEIGATDVPQVLVYNKCDLLEASRRPRQAVDWVERANGQRVRRVFVSAREGEGIDSLRQVLAEAVSQRLKAGVPSPSSAADPRLLPANAGFSSSTPYPPQHV
jgi:GTP-binding protein HflX